MKIYFPPVWSLTIIYRDIAEATPHKFTKSFAHTCDFKYLLLFTVVLHVIYVCFIYIKDICVFCENFWS